VGLSVKHLYRPTKVQETAGGLTEIAMALPHIKQKSSPNVRGRTARTRIEKDASRRLQAILEWRENYENGALYSGLRDIFPKATDESKTHRLTLTAGTSV